MEYINDSHAEMLRKVYVLDGFKDSSVFTPDNQGDFPKMDSVPLLPLPSLSVFGGKNVVATNVDRKCNFSGEVMEVDPHADVIFESVQRPYSR